ncbi:Uncharacterised protein [Mycobacteroides abscessus subsp. abscessus]|nr:Uncharacterised protein [Mycobacteroides abscessus subsp. abscessus]
MMGMAASGHLGMWGIEISVIGMCNKLSLTQ